MEDIPSSYIDWNKMWEHSNLKACLLTKDENIGNHEYIGDISADILEKNIDRLKIVKNSWKCNENLIII